VARECGVSRKTVEGYLEILEDLLLAFREDDPESQVALLLDTHYATQFSIGSSG
jgi:hypothetical protein